MLKSESQQNNDNLTFSPYINPLSKQIFSEKFRNVTPVHERLYDHAKTKQNLINEFNQVQYQSKQQRTRSMTPNEGTLTSERLYKRAKIHDEAIKVAYEKQLKEKEEESTKECTYRPSINLLSQALIKDKRQSQNVLDELYANNKVIQYKKD